METLLDQATIEVNRLRAIGWTQNDFARALEELLLPAPVIVATDIITCGHCRALTPICEPCNNCGRVS